MQIFSRNVIWPLSQIRVIFQDPSETAPAGPAEVLGKRPGAVAQFRHVTAGTKQVLAESPQRPLTGILVRTAGGAPSTHERFCSTRYLTSLWTLVISN